MAYEIEQFESWQAFQLWISQLGALNRDERAQIFFRGQADSRWSLVTTLDRVTTFASDLERRRCIADLVREFRRECTALPEPQGGKLIDEQAWEMLGRHHGLPVPILDWTR